MVPFNIEDKENEKVKKYTKGLNLLKEKPSFIWPSLATSRLFSKIKSGESLIQIICIGFIYF